MESHLTRQDAGKRRVVEVYSMGPNLQRVGSLGDWFSYGKILMQILKKSII